MNKQLADADLDVDLRDEVKRLDEEIPNREATAKLLAVQLAYLIQIVRLLRQKDRR